MSTHTRADIETMNVECAERDCEHVSPIGRGDCPTTVWECCKECSDRSWAESEGPVVTWEECGGVGAYWAEIDAERAQESGEGGRRSMAERMTIVEVPGSGRQGFADHGRREPADMIERLRRIARTERDAAQRVLDAPDSAFIVETYTGVHVQRDRKRLWPDSEGPS